jgi:hypothetical protein
MIVNEYENHFHLYLLLYQIVNLRKKREAYSKEMASLR